MSRCDDVTPQSSHFESTEIFGDERPDSSMTIAGARTLYDHFVAFVCHSPLRPLQLGLPHGMVPRPCSFRMMSASFVAKLITYAVQPSTTYGYIAQRVRVPPPSSAGPSRRVMRLFTKTLRPAESQHAGKHVTPTPCMTLASSTRIHAASRLATFGAHLSSSLSANGISSRVFTPAAAFIAASIALCRSTVATRDAVDSAYHTKERRRESEEQRARATIISREGHVDPATDASAPDRD